MREVGDILLVSRNNKEFAYVPYDDSMGISTLRNLTNYTELTQYLYTRVSDKIMKLVNIFGLSYAVEDGYIYVDINSATNIDFAVKGTMHKRSLLVTCGIEDKDYIDLNELEDITLESYKIKGIWATSELYKSWIKKKTDSIVKLTEANINAIDTFADFTNDELVDVCLDVLYYMEDNLYSLEVDTKKRKFKFLNIISKEVKKEYRIGKFFSKHGDAIAKRMLLNNRETHSAFSTELVIDEEFESYDVVNSCIVRSVAENFHKAIGSKLYALKRNGIFVSRAIVINNSIVRYYGDSNASINTLADRLKELGLKNLRGPVKIKSDVLKDALKDTVYVDFEIDIGNKILPVGNINLELLQ